ncbi:MAG TPA: hypothetical protein VNJ08_06175 [Bacteriovoracaceae bacterium]|nr:hypothetical protein [Bacteriovoracaceae bacterium]
MKFLLVMVLVCTTLNALGEEIKVQEMSADGELERSFVLTTSLPDKVVLDCQSFIQGLRIGEEEQAVFYLLDPHECEAMQDRVKASLKRQQLHCIDIDQDIRSDYTCS